MTFDGVPVPLLSVGVDEIDCVAPFALAGRTSASVQVDFNGVKSNSVLADVALSVLAVLNEDLTPNSPANPAKLGSNITLYVTGAGQTNPASVDGQRNDPPYAPPPVSIQVATGSQFEFGKPIYWDNLEVTFAGAAPGMVAGILQINFVASEGGDFFAVFPGNDPQGFGSAGFNLSIR